jgi:hypothetical protein
LHCCTLLHMHETTIDGQDLYVIHYEGGGGEIAKDVALLFTPSQWEWLIGSLSSPPKLEPDGLPPLISTVLDAEEREDEANDALHEAIVLLKLMLRRGAGSVNTRQRIEDFIEHQEERS